MRSVSFHRCANCVNTNKETYDTKNISCPKLTTHLKIYTVWAKPHLEAAVWVPALG